MTLTIGERAAAMLAEAAAISEPGAGVTRLPFTPEHARANELIGGWMRSAGLKTHIDAAGTLIGRREAATPDAPTFLLGSHQDSVRGGGAYDGIMGVLLPILALEEFGDRPLPFAVEVLCFADEEGVRFPTALIGPRALAGTLDRNVLEMSDRRGISLRDALDGFGDPAAIGDIARPASTVLGYLETHIEQGPVLEAAGLPVGIVTAIAGIERHAVTVTGRAAHAGTAPMELRRDALCAAAELVSAVERICRETDQAVGTIGHLDVAPNVVNAVPAKVHCTIELRSAEDTIRTRVAERVAAAARDAAAQRDCSWQMERTYQQPAMACAPRLQDALATAIKTAGQRPLHLMSGATHDASAMADLCPVAMLFVRCRDGVSHNPAEYAAPEDMERAVVVLREFLKRLASDEDS
ncbi:allantoate amidohydrolase [Tropicimonas marinistellae]|uniref:allantoate amidohydrolase n=1 Tax=Tropicimonas marinistellae TaxID=1739787 RepID=UPI00082A1A3F|nr:allantoate amidohydrolase [Tropicimonas marinistellae]